MKLGLRVLLGFFVINGIAAFIGLRLFVAEVRPSVRQVMEDLMVDTANILAELVRDDLAHLPAMGTLEASPFAQRVRDYASRPVDAKIWGLSKRTLDYRVYVTDATGRVVFDSGFRGSASASGADYSQWRDVALTLSGRSGARATREVRSDESTSVMYVAAPVRSGAADVIGVLTVAKPMSTVQQFVTRAEREILVRGAWLLGVSAAVGGLITGWLVWSVRRLRRYAQGVQLGQRIAAPRLSGELGELALAMQDMRERLEGREHIEGLVRALTHELKSPLTAIAGAAELLRDDLPAADREAFSEQIQTQSVRLRQLVERLLELSKLEHRRQLERSTRIDLVACAHAAQAGASARAMQRGVAIDVKALGAPCIVGDADLIQVALSNLLDNAIDFEPAGGSVSLTVQTQGHEAVLSVRDHGIGVPQYALPRLGERFFSTPRPSATGDAALTKGSGLGLAIVRQIVELHSGTLRFAGAEPGFLVEMRFARA
ncbi:MAG: two-component system sensor histidine kinase CreC [Burkholderiaceae bacterium]